MSKSGQIFGVGFSRLKYCYWSRLYVSFENKAEWINGVLAIAPNLSFFSLLFDSLINLITHLFFWYILIAVSFHSSISNIPYSDFHQPVPSFFRADDKSSKARLLWKSKTIEVFCVLHSVGSYCFQKNRTTAIESLKAVFPGEKLWGKMLLWLAFFF